MVKFKFYTSLLLPIFLFTACGQFRMKYVEEEALPYLAIYNQYKIQYLDNEFRYNVNVFFENLESTKIGECRIYSDGHKEIGIDYDFWKQASDTDREILMLHELGHCDLRLGHMESPAIMQQYHLSSRLYKQQKETLLREFFGLLSESSYSSLEKENGKCH